MPPELRGKITEATISPEFTQALNQRWQQYYKQTKINKTTGESAQVVGFLSKPILDWLTTENITIENSAITVLKSKIKHLEGGHKSATSSQAWGEEYLLNLPAHLASYKAAFWDSNKKNLLYVLDLLINGRAANVVIAINFAKKGRAMSAVVHAGSSDLANYLEKHRILIDGAVE